MDHLLEITQSLATDPESRDDFSQYNIDQMCEKRVDQILKQLKRRIMARYDIMKQRRDEKLQTELQQIYQQSLQVYVISILCINIFIMYIYGIYK